MPSSASNPGMDSQAVSLGAHSNGQRRSSHQSPEIRFSQVQDCSPVIITCGCTSSNKKRKSGSFGGTRGVDDTAYPPTRITPSSTNAEVCLGSDDRRNCNCQIKLQGRQVVFCHEGKTNNQRSNAPTSPPLRAPPAEPLMVNKRRVISNTETVDKDQSYNAIADTKRMTHSINEHKRRQAETVTIDKIDKLLPSELLVDFRMGNSKQGHTKLQTLKATVQFLEALPEDAKQWAMKQCRGNLANTSPS